MQKAARFVVVTATLIASRADAQWRVDVSGGALVAPWAVHLPDAELKHQPQFTPLLNFSTDTRFGTGGSYAVGMSYSVTDHVELGGQFQQSLSRQVDRLGVKAGSTGTFTSKPALDVFSVTFGGRIHLLPSDHRVRPWFVGQVGWYRATAEVDELFAPATCVGHCPIVSAGIHHSGTDDGFGFNVGGGVDVALTRWLSIGADVRYHRAVNVLGNVDFVTTMTNLSFHF